MKSALVASALLAAASAGPVTKRFTIQSEDASSVGASDAAILTYALVLEHLEDAFYRGGLQNFTAAQFAAAGFDAAFYANLVQIAADEANHVAFLTAGLTAAGATPPAECVYSVSSFSIVSPIVNRMSVTKRRVLFGEALQCATCVERSLTTCTPPVPLHGPIIICCSGVGSRRRWGFRVPRGCSRYRIQRLLDGSWFNLDHRSQALIVSACFAWRTCIPIVLRHPPRLQPSQLARIPIFHQLPCHQPKARRHCVP